MSRRNYQEDWERKKSYLIRSLFQDIPVLSPVPEDPDSQSGAGSPSNVPPSRSYSPLPPLIIERMPNKHDHSEEFYQDLEVKMKKLYRKLFFNEGSSSVEDLMETYAGNLSTIDQNESKNKILADGLALSRNTTGTIDSSEESNQSSTHSLCRTQITTEVEVHKEPSSDHDETVRLHHDIQSTSLVFECHRIGYKKTLQQIDMYNEKRNEETDDDNNEMGETKTLGFTKEIDSKEEEIDQVSSNETSYESIEVMRRHRVISPSQGSLPCEPIISTSPRRSSTYKNIKFQKEISLPSENVSCEDQQNSMVTSFSSVSVDFHHNVLTTSTPELKNKRSSSKSSSPAGKRVRSESSSTENYSIKRRKFENIAIQTSLISESDAETVDWNQLKKNFFVGTPKIYKLCSCKDHECNDE